MRPTTYMYHNKLNITNYSKPKYCSLQPMTHAGQLLKRKVYCCILLNAILSVRKKKTQMTLIKFKREIILPNQQKL